MSGKENKVKYNLKNVHWAELIDEKAFQFGPVEPWPGAVSLSLGAEGETNVFYADGIAFYTSVSNNGYTGDFESALVPDKFSEGIMGNTKDENGVQLEDADAVPKAFALLFEFDGDAKAIRRVLFNCKMTRPSIESETIQGSIEPKTETGTLTATPLIHPPTGKALVQGKTTADTTAAAYNAWYDQVYTPGAINQMGELSVVSTEGTESGKTAAAVDPAKENGNIYRIKTAADVTAPAYDEDCSGSGYQDWDGSAEITASAGDKLLVVECTAGGKARKAGIASVTAKA